MGLDQFWMIDNGDSEPEELHYHRKFPALEDFMADKWYESGGEAPFNCERIDITLEILNELKDKVKNKSLDHNASGFFWGKHYDEDYEDIAEVVSKAEAAIAEGKVVYYTSWW